MAGSVIGNIQLSLFAASACTPSSHRHPNPSVPSIVPLLHPRPVLCLCAVLPLLVEFKLEYSYLAFSDLPMSLAFFAHQNRISAFFFGSTMCLGSATYMGTKRGIGNAYIPLLQIFVHHFFTNFLDALKIGAVLAIYLGSGGQAMLVWTLFLSVGFWIGAPILYNPNPSIGCARVHGGACVRACLCLGVSPEWRPDTQ